MEILQIGCLSLVVLVIILVIIGTILSGIDNKKIVEQMRQNGWQSIKNPIEKLKEWVKTDLKSEPDRYTVFGEVREWYLISDHLSRNRMFISNLWTKQDGNKMYFVLNVSDHYSQGRGGRSADFTIIGMRSHEMSLPFFTLLPKIKIPKSKGWHYAISRTHGLNLINEIDQARIIDSQSPYNDPRIKPPLELPKIFAEETPVPKILAIDPPINFDSKPFNERFELYGKETERLRQFFDNEKLTALESLPQTFVDGGGEVVFVYIPEHKPTLEGFEKYINDGIAIINAVCREP